MFELEGVEITFRENALKQIAKRAILKKSGARGLRSIMEHMLLDLMYELPDMPGLKQVVLDENVVLGTGQPLFIYQNDHMPHKVVQE